MELRDRLKRWALGFARALLPGWIKYRVKRAWLQHLLPERASPAWESGSQVKLAPGAQGRYDLVYLSMVDWGYRYQRPQHLVSQFAAQGHRVFYVSVTFSGLSHQGQPEALVRPLKDRVYEIQLPGPVGFNPYRSPLRSSRLELQLRALHSLIENQGMDRAACMVGLPFWAPLAFALKGRRGWPLIYDCIDHHQGFSNFGAKMLAQERGLVERSNLVVVTSSALLEKHGNHNPRCVLVPNAADFRHFQRPAAAMPPELSGLARPIIGYHGAIEDWLDVKLLHEVARARPGWSFVLIGRIGGAPVTRLQRLPNVRFLGEIGYEALPEYVCHFDVGIIPFKITPLTEAADPVKFYEYLSAGLPVVATDLRELRPFRSEGLVHLAQTPGAFLHGIERSLAQSADCASRGRSFAKRNQWADRCDYLKQAIETHAGVA